MTSLAAVTLRRGRFWDFALLALVLVLPLIGAALAGRPLAPLFRFPPPLEIPRDYPRFSWAAAGALIVALGCVTAAWIAGARRTRGRTVAPSETRALPPRALPAWGWGALGWTSTWWWLAWTRYPGFAPLQPYTFFPLWIGFIVAVNAWTFARTGRCRLTHEPLRLARLFLASAAFWWVFEWLNRFVQNWHYLGVQAFDAPTYALHASVCFSTVLPAVASVADLLQSWTGWRAWAARGPAWTWLGRRAVMACVGALALAALLFTGIRPQLFYPSLWAAPLLLFLSLDALLGRPGPGAAMARGDWTDSLSWIAAALVCGVFWELWNWHSEAKWIYTVPGVERWRLFEMPLLGYSGYLPFGLECWMVAERGKAKG